MIVMGIDPSSTHSGVAVVDSETGRVLYSGEIVPKKLTGFDRISFIVFELIRLHAEYKPDHVVIEGMFIGHASSAVQLVALGSILRYFLWQEDITYIEVPATTLKKFVTGSGTAPKDAVMMHVLKNWGFESASNNVADAVGLAMFGVAHYETNPVTFKKAQFDVVAQYRTKKAASGL